MNSLAIKKENFSEERFIETAKKFSDVSQHHTFENFVIMHKTAIEVFGDYMGVRPIENSDIINMMEEDKELNKIAKERNGLPGRRFLRLHIDHITMSIVQGHYLYTRNDHEYEIAILNKNGMISCCEFSKLKLPDGINTGDYVMCKSKCQEEYCGSQVIGYLQFNELIEYICAVAELYLSDKWQDITF